MITYNLIQKSFESPDKISEGISENLQGINNSNVPSKKANISTTINDTL